MLYMGIPYPLGKRFPATVSPGFSWNMRSQCNHAGDFHEIPENDIGRSTEKGAAQTGAHAISAPDGQILASCADPATRRGGRPHAPERSACLADAGACGDARAREERIAGHHGRQNGAGRRGRDEKRPSGCGRIPCFRPVRYRLPGRATSSLHGDAGERKPGFPFAIAGGGSSGSDENTGAGNPPAGVGPVSIGGLGAGGGLKSGGSPDRGGGPGGSSGSGDSGSPGSGGMLPVAGTLVLGYGAGSLFPGLDLSSRDEVSRAVRQLSGAGIERILQPVQVLERRFARAADAIAGKGSGFGFNLLIRGQPGTQLGASSYDMVALQRRFEPDERSRLVVRYGFAKVRPGAVMPARAVPDSSCPRITNGISCKVWCNLDNQQGIGAAWPAH